MQIVDSCFYIPLTERVYALSMERNEQGRKLLLELVNTRISMRAFELYQSRRGQGFSALDDWLQAEKETLGHSILAPLYELRP